MRQTHLTEEELTNCYYSLDAAGAAEAGQHLAGCEICRRELAALGAALELVDEWEAPPREADYARRVWRTMEGRIQQRAARPRAPWFRWSQWPGWALAGTMAALLLISFQLGRRTAQPDAPSTVAGGRQVQPLQERLLLVTLNDHLEASQRLLTEVSNYEGSGLEMDRDSASELVAANRLYRQTARQTGDRATLLLLEDLERYLLEAAHASPEEWKSLQQRMKEDDILFQLRVLNSQLRQRQSGLLPRASN